MSSKTMLFDVESIGLHGEGYAVAYSVFDVSTGEEFETGLACCPSYTAKGLDVDRNWILEHVDPHLPDATHDTPGEVRDFFWDVWSRQKPAGTYLYAHCGWPVEANFLSACVNKDTLLNRFAGPFPLRDVADVVHCAREASDTWTSHIHFGRMDDEYPEHDPVADVRHSARILREATQLLRRSSSRSWRSS